VLPLLGQNLLSGEEAALSHRAIASARTVAAHASAHLVQAIITHACGAVMGLHAACLRAEHIDAPPSDQAGIPWCQPTCPVCQWQAILLTWAHLAHLPAFNAVVGLEPREGPSATGTWQGQPRSCRRGGTWRHRTPSQGRGVRAPEAGRSGQALGGLDRSRGGPRPPWESGSVGATREHPCPHGHVEAPDL
jgi:hypothetical protein